MKKFENLTVTGILSLTFLVLQGCYTQLAINKHFVVTEQFVYQSQDNNFSQSESFPDILQDGEISPDTIIEKHYWLVDPYSPQFGYNPLFDDISFYHSFHLTYYDSYWYPWHYSRYRPYWAGYYYTGWYYYDPFWYDPFWYNPFGSFAYYPGYYSGYGYPYWGGYQPSYIVDPIPDKKRDWDRRGADLTHNTIVRPSNSSAGQGYLASVVDRTETGTSTIKRNENGITKPIQRTENDSEIKKPRIHKRDDNNGNKSQTIKRIYHVVSYSNRSGNNDNKKSKNSKNTTIKRNTGSHSNHSATKPVHRSISRSNVRSHSKSYSAGTSHPGKTRGGSSKSRTRK
ncbi:MAG: hypothetical protein IIB45_08510 [Candidatus Marinimicrobia bacterium]|nr:hypothetical protein [Candidatus Neomarinimicrobiota bacterium]